MTDRWLPPQAPGGQPPPRFDMVVPDPAPARPAGQPVMPERFQPRPAPAPPATNGPALTALIFGMLGLAILVLSVGLLAPLAIPCSVAAWLYGAQTRARIDVGEATGGRGHAVAGYLLGVAGVVIGVAAAVGWIIYFANGGDLEQLQRDIERYRDSQSTGAILTAARLLFAR